VTAAVAAAAGADAVAADDANGARPGPDQLTQQSGEAPPAAGKPVRVFTDGQGRTCHVYDHTVKIDNAPQTAYAIICQLQNGRWVLVR
jgi:hypothetical protein